MLDGMETPFRYAVPVLPAADVAASLRWWTEVCGFVESFRSGDPPGYAGIHGGDVMLHLAKVDDTTLARTVGDQVMVRIAVNDIHDFYAAFQERGGKIHPNGALHEQPWGGRAFGAIDPNGVCVTFVE
jgi:catechol 2,3-dioxygenase-like lactoylglutathione lyase family enzyme